MENKQFKNMKKFTKNDWDHLHDCVLDVTWKTTQTNLSQKEMEELFEKLPEDLKADAHRWGMNDTCWRDNFIDWYANNLKQ